MASACSPANGAKRLRHQDFTAFTTNAIKLKGLDCMRYVCQRTDWTGHWVYCSTIAAELLTIFPRMPSVLRPSPSDPSQGNLSQTKQANTRAIRIRKNTRPV
jgi:hypothetical protein